MFTTESAKKLLLNSLKDLESKKSNLSIDEYAADIINVTCKYFLENEEFESGPEAIEYFPVIYMDYHEQVEEFISSIKSYYPKILTQQGIGNLAQNVCLNLGWNGMSGFLDEYFYRIHGIPPQEEQEYREFISTNHKRLVCGNLSSSSEVDRNINLTFTDNRKKMSVTIIPSLSRKESKLVSQNGNTYIYRGNDPDYFFEVHFDEYDDVDFFALELQPRNLRIEYI